MFKLTFLEKVLFVSVICLVVSTAAFAYSAIMLISNPIIGEVKSKPDLLLELNPLVIYEGETFSLKAILTSGQSNVQVDFWWNDTNWLGTAFTDGSGIAAISFTPAAVGFYNFTAVATFEASS
jgi:hypothetical protein